MSKPNAYDDKSQLAVLFCHDTSEVPWPKDAPRIGQKLYYKDKWTGEVKSGEVIKEGRFKFRFMFDYNKVVRLDVSVVGRRLFQFEFDAANYGLTMGNNVRREH